MCVVANEFTGSCATPRLLLMLAAPASGNSFAKHSLQALVTLTLYYLAKPTPTKPLITFYHTWFTNMTNTMMYCPWWNGQSTEMNHFKQITLLSNVSNLIHRSEHNCIFIPGESYMVAIFAHAMLIKNVLLNSLLIFILGWESKSFQRIA